MEKTYKYDELKALLLRFWGFGAVCFFIVNGTTTAFSILDMMFICGIVHLLAEKLVMSPIIRGAFKTKLDLRPKYTEIKSTRRVVMWLVDFLQIAIIIFLTIYTFQFINYIPVALDWVDSKTVILGVTPIPYALIFGTWFYLFYILNFSVFKKLFQKGETQNGI